MPLCPLDGDCVYNDKRVCGVDYCLFPAGGCPHDLAKHPGDNAVEYRRALGGMIATRVKNGATEEDAELRRLRELFRASLERPRDKGGGKWQLESTNIG